MQVFLLSALSPASCRPTLISNRTAAYMPAWLPNQRFGQLPHKQVALECTSKSWLTPYHHHLQDVILLAHIRQRLRISGCNIHGNDFVILENGLAWVLRIPVLHKAWIDAIDLQRLTIRLVH